MEKEKLKTGTTIVGVVGKDCIVLGADKRVTLAGRLVVDKRFNKILQVNENIVVAMAGTVSDAQLLTKYLRANLKLNELRRNKKNDIKEYVDSAWIVSIIRGIIISIVIFFSAAFVSGFFRSPDSIFLIQLISIIPLIRGFINPSSVKFQKNLEFYKEFWYRFVIFSFDAVVAIVFAYITKSAISLVFGLLAGVIIEVILSFLVVKPIPHL